MPKSSKPSLKRYVDGLQMSGVEICPQCGTAYTGGHEILEEHLNIVVVKQCSYCGAEWHDVFEFQRFVLHEKEDPK